MPSYDVSGTRRQWLLATIGIAALAASAFALFRHPSSELPVVDLAPAKSSGPAMCPWRNPKRDMAAFFPGADSSRSEILALSSIRKKILDRLESGHRLENLALYVYRILRHDKVVGSVLARRAAGPHGAIEVVTAVDPAGAVTGLVIQRHREPPEVARAMTDPAWLQTFKGKTAGSVSQPGDAPASPLTAEAEETVRRTVRTVLIELEEAEKYYAASHSKHH